ncbi:MAG: hypothetical protein ACW981_13690 [Candidatus Hodarchaeales archaeon]|jgi:hypothetical protein
MDEKNFQEYSVRIRNKFNMKLDDFWVIEQLYMILDNHPGGFLLKFDDKIYLGIKVMKKDFFIYNILYKDVASPGLKEITINVRKLMTEDGRIVKVQWFGLFHDLKVINSLPSFTILNKYNYELILSQEYLTKVISETHLTGDYYAYFAQNSKINYENLIQI